MSQSGNIVFFSTDTSLDPPKLILQSLQLVECDLVLGVYRSHREDREWDRLQASLNGEDDEEGDGCIVSCGEDTSEYVANRVLPAKVPEYLRTGTSLRLLLGNTTLGRKLWCSLQDAFPESTRGTFMPSDPSIVVGGHDIYECAEHDEGHLFGRAFFSFSIFGYGTPNDWDAYRGVIFDVPAMQELQKQLEAFAGPLERCVHWSV